MLSSTLVGAAAASLALVTASAWVSAMIGLFGEASAPRHAGGTALNGFLPLFYLLSSAPASAQPRPLHIRVEHHDGHRQQTADPSRHVDARRRAP
jgi:hypothetical protein